MGNSLHQISTLRTLPIVPERPPVVGGSASEARASLDGESSKTVTPTLPIISQPQIDFSRNLWVGVSRA